MARLVLNGEPREEIVFEGVCNRPGLCQQYAMNYAQLTLPSIIGICFCVPCGLYSWITGVHTWRLYLTHSGIYHSFAGGCCFSKIEYDIPFGIIEDIYVPSNLTVAILDNEDPTCSVHVCMDASELEKRVPYCSRSMCSSTSTLSLDYVANAQDFVNAVKREMASHAHALVHLS
jgi:hypothetical protein